MEARRLEAVMAERANVGRFAEAGMSLGRAIRRVDRTVSRTLDPMNRWGAAYLESRPHEQRWHA